MAGISVNKHRQTTRPVFSAQLSTKPRTKLHAYFLGAIENPSLRAESEEGTTNVLAMTVLNCASVATAVQSNRKLPKVWQGAALFWQSNDPAQWQMAKNIGEWRCWKSDYLAIRLYEMVKQYLNWAKQISPVHFILPFTAISIILSCK